MNANKDNAALIDEFLSFTGTTTKDVAKQYLEMASNNLEVAISLFLEVGEEQQQSEELANNGEAVDTTGDNDANNAVEDERSSINLSEPDYDHLVTDENDTTFDTLCHDIIGDAQKSSAVEDVEDDMDISPDYDHLAAAQYDNLGLDCAELSAAVFDEFAASPTKDIVKGNSKEISEDDDQEYNFYAEEVIDDGEEYILGTMMVRVLQARHVKSNPNNNQGGNMIANLLSSHRRNRHQQRPTMSPASAIASGNLTPYSNHILYAKLSYKDQAQLTSNALEHNMNGDYHWSRSDQTYFDVTCPAFPLNMGKKKPSFTKSKQAFASATALMTVQKGDVSCGSSSKSNSNIQQQQQQSYQSNTNNKRSPSSPILQISIYSKTNNTGSSGYNKQKKGVSIENNDDYLVGKCSINILQILSGKTAYFDEWCDLEQPQNKDNNKKNNDDDTSAGRVRIVIEYEPTDPPPRSGDICTFANVYPLVEQLYPIPLVRSNMSTISTTSLSYSITPKSSTSTTFKRTIACYPKTFTVEEVVGDHVVLSYTTPIENWHCTFEAHRYLLLCVERHQAVVEKYKERVLDLCDNVSQSPAVEQITKTVHDLPEEGLVYVGADLAGGTASLLGRWWETGVDGIVEDVVDGINLDGRYSHLSDDEGDGDNHNEGVAAAQYTPSLALDMSETSRSSEKKALPGMPCCPITGLPMIEPVVAADGHTYERSAIARWLQESNRSPLTGGILAHSELVSNYLLLSSLSNKGSSVQEEDDEEEDIDICEERPGLVDVL